MTSVFQRVPVQQSWTRCPGCGELNYAKKLARAMGVCPECGHHHRLTAAERIGQLADPGSFEPLDVRVVATDVLGFVDSQAYPDRLAKARSATGMDDAVHCGLVRLGGVPLMLAVMDFRFMGGSLGAAVGELITRTAEEAVDRSVPLLIVSASGGARMQEGVLALMQMAKISQALAALRDAGLLSISLITDPTYGGVAASFATNCDVLVIEKGARMGFAGPRVIEQTIRQRLPEDFQTADFLLAHGQVDTVQHRHELRGWLRSLLWATRCADEADEITRMSAREKTAPLIRDPRLLDPVDAWDAVATARRTTRPTALDYIDLAFDGFVELHGDRLAADCPSIVAGFARLHGRPVAVLGHQKGHQTAELVSRNFGMPQPEGYRKALRVMRLADRLGIPVVSIVDTPGAYPGRDAEEHGQSVAIAESILGMFELGTPVVTVITGEGGSGGALALAVANRVLMFERAVYSVITPEGCSAILWPDAASAPAAARALGITAHNLLELGVVDGVLPEPSTTDHEAGWAQKMATALGDAVSRMLAELEQAEDVDLIRDRRARFRGFGAQGTLISECGRESVR
nr:acetyl-CoA carboxylase carboxyl transferase subunit [Kibdelosporangium sp. MJ126-NF4]CEL20090.1 Acetyl-coenzyme A carboxyl transferase alpha chain / Acetyl-coenzyme A carboxyl transferase beta chain [Kibdelosporangium sp. MJ126-NF4]CTQ97314.1 Acetyl-coenzyme A carboxyl transferase alpha chain (EC 6.4.1.2) / Acetyl-coenzyme A carboxyl transferase beta chain (EC 6.4.1.2) [Kibdelosporangium sp. MJ126-NF4]